MASKYKYYFFYFLLFFQFQLFSQNKEVLIFFKDINETSDPKTVFALYFLNSIESELIFDHYTVTLIRENVDVNYFISIKNYSINRSKYGFFYVYFDQGDLVFDLYDSKGKLLTANRFSFQFVNDPFFHQEMIEKEKNNILKTIRNDLLNMPEEAVLPVVITKKSGFSLVSHDFPYFSLGISAVSFYLYYDDLSNFSLFPISILLSFFPFRYFELGLFYRVSYEGVYFKYLDVASDSYRNHVPLINHRYGLFFGLSFFYEKTHYSLGLSIYNENIILHDTNTWSRTEDLSLYFLPQFSIYQKFEIKLFKNIYYSMWINLHTNQKFILKDNRFYADLFDYDYILLEISLLGISVIF